MLGKSYFIPFISGVRNSVLCWGRRFWGHDLVWRSAEHHVTSASRRRPNQMCLNRFIHPIPQERGWIVMCMQFTQIPFNPIEILHIYIWIEIYINLKSNLKKYIYISRIFLKIPLKSRILISFKASAMTQRTCARRGDSSTPAMLDLSRLSPVQMGAVTQWLWG